MANSKAIESTAELLQVLTQNRLLKPAEARQLGESNATEAVSIARFLMKKGRLTKWQATQLLSGTPSLLVGAYQLREALGPCTFGTLYQAKHLESGDEVALLLLAGKAASEEAIARRMSEGHSGVRETGTVGNRQFAVLDTPAAADAESLAGIKQYVEAWLGGSHDEEVAPGTVETEESDVASGGGLKLDLGESFKPPVAAPGSFTINTKRRKKSPAKEPAPPVKSEVKQETKEDPPVASSAAPEERPAEGRRFPARLIVGAACVLGLLLLVSIALAGWWLLGGPDEPVAQAPPAAPAPESAPTGSVLEDELDLLGLSEPTVGQAPLSGTAFASPQPSAQQSAPLGSTSVATDDTTAASSEVSQPDQPETPDGTLATSGDAASEPMPVGATEDAPAPAQPESTAAEPEIAAPAQPAKPSPPRNVFAFAPAVDLPAPTEVDEITLGKVDVGKEDAVFISLFGGETATRGRYEFSLQNAQGGIAPRDWEIYVGSPSSDPQVVATLAMPDKELKFRWTDAAGQNAVASSLRNCSLRITAGQGEPREVSLRRPKQIAAVPIDLAKPVVTAKWRMEGPPDPSSLRMEVTVNGFKASVEPPQLNLEKGATAEVIFGENREQAALLLRLDADVNPRGVEVRLSPFFVIPGQSRPLALNKKNRGLFNNVGSERQRAEATVIQLKNLPKEQVERVLPQAQQRLQLATEIQAKLEQLEQDYAAIQDKVTLQFRVFAVSLDQEVDLLVTDANASPQLP